MERPSYRERTFFSKLLPALRLIRLVADTQPPTDNIADFAVSFAQPNRLNLTAYNTALAYSSQNFFRELHVKSNAKLALYFSAAGTYYYYDNTGNFTLNAGEWYQLAAVWKAGVGLYGYVNGIEDGSYAAVGTLTTLESGSDYLQVGNDRPNCATRFIDGQAQDILAFDRALEPSELRSLYENRWQIYLPLKRRIYVPVAGAAGPQALTPMLILSAPVLSKRSRSQPRGQGAMPSGWPMRLLG